MFIVQYVVMKNYILTVFLIIFSSFSIAQCDTLITEKDTIKLFKNKYGEELQYQQLILETNRIIQLDSLGIEEMEIQELLYALKLYNTILHSGLEFIELHIEFINFFDNFLMETSIKKLELIPSGSAFYSKLHNVYLGGNMFFHQNSRFKLVC